MLGYLMIDMTQSGYLDIVIKITSRKVLFTIVIETE